MNRREYLKSFLKPKQKRLPRKLKKKLRKRGLDPTVYLHRERNLQKLFTKDYNDPHSIIRKELRVDDDI